MWLSIVHVVLVTIYVGLPLVLVALAMVLRVDRRETIATLLAGLVIGGGLTGGYAASPGQALLCGYFATSLLTMLKLLDAATRRIPIKHTITKQAARWSILLLVGGPWLMATTMVYRPKVVPDVQPIGTFEVVRFGTSDGVNLVGWWLPARLDDGRSLLVVPGLGSGKADLLATSETFRDRGWHVLVVDPRAHGESGGQLTSFGDGEQRDVAAAARWLEQERPADRRVAVGFSMGGAALLPHAERFDAVAIVDTYDTLPKMAGELVPRPLAWVGLPLASLHVGRALWRVDSTQAAANRSTPLLVIHSRDDDVIPFARGRSLFEAAAEPKTFLAVDGYSHAEVMTAFPVLDAIDAFLTKQ